MSVREAGKGVRIACAGRLCAGSGLRTCIAAGITAGALQAWQAAATHIAGSSQPKGQQGEAMRAAAAPCCRANSKTMTRSRTRRMPPL